MKDVVFNPGGPASGIVAMSTRHELERFCLEAVPVPLREGLGQAPVATPTFTVMKRALLLVREMSPV